MARHAEPGLMARRTVRVRLRGLAAVRAKPTGTFVGRRQSPLVATNAEVLRMTGRAVFGVLLSLARVHWEPAFGMHLVALVAIGTEQTLVASIAQPGLTAEFFGMLRHPPKLMLPLELMTIRTEILCVADLAALLRLLEFRGVCF